MVSLTRLAALPLIFTVLFSLADHVYRSYYPAPTYIELLASAGVDATKLSVDNSSDVAPTVVITGCTSGIGEAITKALHNDLQFTIICLSRSPDKMTKLKNQHNLKNFLGVKCDLGDLTSVKAAIKKGE